VHFAPRLELTVLSGASASALPQPRLAATVRGERVEAPAAPAGLPTVPDFFRTPAITPPPFRPVPRTVRQPIAAAPAGDHPPATDEPAAARRPARALTGQPNAYVPGPIDVNRLTDEVVRAIDRRIVAQRERLGRV
jgi:hypothetical protein